MQKTTLNMSKRPFDTNQNKVNRNDRFAQMTQQELLIEQKKREIQAKLEAKRRQNNQEPKDKPKSPKLDLPAASTDGSLPAINVFSNDGSFLDQFKQLKEKKGDTKFKTFNKYKDKEREREREREERERQVQLEKEKESIVLNEKEEIPIRSPSPQDSEQTLISAGSFDPFNTSFTSNPPPNLNTNNLPTFLTPPPLSSQPIPPLLATDFSVPPQINFTTPPTSQLITQQLPPPPLIQQPPNLDSGQINITASQQTAQAPGASHLFTTQAEQIVSAPPQVLLNVPPPQILPQAQIVIAPQEQNVLVAPPTSILTTVTIPPPVIAPQNMNVGAPNVLNISAPNVLNVRPTGLPPTVELTSIPPPNPIQVQNIPQPEPLNTLNIPPPAPLQVSTIPTPASLQLNEIPNPKPIDLMAIPTPMENEEAAFTADQSFLKNIPPPNKNMPPPTLGDVNFVSNKPASPPVVPNRIPSLMSQRVLPPPGMGMNIPPPPRHQHPPPNYSVPPPMPNMNVPPPIIPRPPNILPPEAIKEELTGGAEYVAMRNLARMVAECGPSVEDVVRQKKNRDPELWFLFHKESSAYRRYANLVEQYRSERHDEEESNLGTVKDDTSEMYEPEMALEDDEGESSPPSSFKEIKQEDDPNNAESSRCRRERKRKSRWGEKNFDLAQPVMVPPVLPPVPGSSTMLSKLTRSDPGLLQYAMQTYGSTNLSDEDWKKAEDNYKIHLLYQDMLKKREELKILEMRGQNKYEYDSDEETEGGTWEHKLREKEMQATELWAVELTRQAEGKHHIGDFLPPEELKRFMEKSNALKEGRQPNFSDYKDFKIKEDNIGFKMLQKLGWNEGQGLGQNNAGIVEPVNKGIARENTQGLGLNVNEATEDEDEYESYRKRMMLAYRFRPNPLNNPRRPYY